MAAPTCCAAFAAKPPLKKMPGNSRETFPWPLAALCGRYATRADRSVVASTPLKNSGTSKPAQQSELRSHQRAQYFLWRCGQYRYLSSLSGKPHIAHSPIRNQLTKLFLRQIQGSVASALISGHCTSFNESKVNSIQCVFKPALRLI